MVSSKIGVCLLPREIVPTSRSHKHLFNLIKPNKVLRLYHKRFMIAISLEKCKSVDCKERISQLTTYIVDYHEHSVDWLC